LVFRIRIQPPHQSNKSALKILANLPMYPTRMVVNPVNQECHMRPNQLILRCYAERDGALWMAVCLDLSLAAQGDSFEDARRKLDAQIQEYVKDALGGQDEKHAAYLMSQRKAPFAEWARYYFMKWAVRLARAMHRPAPAVTPFRERIPMVPASC